MNRCEHGRNLALRAWLQLRTSCGVMSSFRSPINLLIPQSFSPHTSSRRNVCSAMVHLSFLSSRVSVIGLSKRGRAVVKLQALLEPPNALDLPAQTLSSLSWETVCSHKPELPVESCGIEKAGGPFYGGTRYGIGCLSWRLLLCFAFQLADWLSNMGPFSWMYSIRM